MEKTRCTEDDDRALLPVLSGSAVMSVQPLYSNAGSGKNGLQPELRGATLSVSALPAMTPEWLDRALECHSAKVILGRVQASANDPFFLPDSPVDIDVRPTKDSFDVAISAYSADDARKILERATAFVRSKPPAPAK
jgi:hypothetical protein